MISNVYPANLWFILSHPSLQVEQVIVRSLQGQIDASLSFSHGYRIDVVYDVLLREFPSWVDDWWGGMWNVISGKGCLVELDWWRGICCGT